VKPSHLSHWLRVSVMLALCSFTAYACGGAKFTATPGSGGSGTGGSGNVGAAGGAGPKIACQGPEDCDDSDACSVDQCGADGACTRAAKCGATEKCCEGSCGQCCDGTDCDDGVKCTDDECFAGGCTHSPNNVHCDTGEYCSATADCRRKETCADDAGCDDADACTDDTCVTTSLLCEHTASACSDPQKSLCCAGVGCAECCEDSQCNDKDPCTKDSCSDNGCEHVPFCAEGQNCCAAADGSSATCGTCCSATDCDDNVRCTKDSCTQGTCGHTDDQSCPSGSVCDASKGCVVAAECVNDAECKSADACQTNPACVNGKCTFAACPMGTKCCGLGEGCKACCSDTDCSDGLGCTKDSCNDGVCSHQADNGLCTAAVPICDPKLGCIDCNTAADCNDGIACTADTCEAHKCVNSKLCNERCCCSNADCQGGIINAAGPIGTKCTYNVCGPAGACMPKTATCPVIGGCCKYGCCGVETQ
jgi:hypothetical protein